MHPVTVDEHHDTSSAGKPAPIVVESFLVPKQRTLGIAVSQSLDVVPAASRGRELASTAHLLEDHFGLKSLSSKQSD